MSGFDIGAFVLNVALSFGTSLLIKALTPPVKIEGQKLRDLNNSESAFGTPIPKCYGTFRLAGNCMWQLLFYNASRQQWLPFDEVATTEHVGGKGGGGASVTNYSYYWTGAIMFAVGPAVKIRKMWAHTKLIIDNSPGSIITVKPGVSYRFYRGTDDQPVDPAIEADVDGREGPGSTPAYRNRVYIVLDRFPLADYGNTLPKFSAEIVFDGDVESQFVSPTLIDSLDDPTAEFAALNWYNNVYYTVDHDNLASSPVGLRKMRLGTNEQLASNTDPTTFAPPGASGLPYDITALGIYAPTDGQLYMMMTGSAVIYLARLDPDSMTLLDYYATDGAGEYNQVYSEKGAHAVAQWWADNEHGALNFLATTSATGCVNIWALDPDQAPTLVFTLDISDQTNDPCVASASYGYDQPIFYAVGVKGSAVAATNSAYLNVWKFIVGHEFNQTQWHIPGAASFPVEDELIATIDKADLIASTGDTLITGIADADAMVVDMLDDNPIFNVHVYRQGSSPSSSYFWVKVDKDEGYILWAMPGYLDQYTSVYGLSIVNGSMVMRNPAGGAASFARYNTVNGELLETFTSANIDWDTGVGATVGFYSYNYLADASFISIDGNTGQAGPVFWSNVDPRGVPLSEIVESISVMGSADGEYAGLTAADLDVTELANDYVPGYGILTNQSKREAIEPLAKAYFFDGVESDYLMKFKKFGQLPDVEIESGEMVRKDNYAIQETREDEAQMPGSVSISHLDWERDHLAGEQHDKRTNNPSRSGWSDSKIEMNLPIVMTANTAKAIARRALYSRWVEREKQAFMLTRERMLLDPLDTATLVMPDHEVVVRLLDTTLGMDWSMDCSSLAEETSLAAIDADAVTADGGAYFPQSLQQPTGTMRLYVIDGPYMQDIDVGPESYAQTYLAASPVNTNSTAGAQVYESIDALSWEVAGGTGSAPNMGVLASDLDPPESPDRTDTINSIHVRMWNGTPVNITQEQFRNHENPLILLNRTTGELEYVVYRDAVQNVDGSWTLSHLRRGARGTDGMPMTFTAGDYMIMPSTASLTRMRIPLAQLSLTHFFRAVPVGGVFDQQPNYTRVVYGRELMPWAPTCVHADFSSPGTDIELSCQRRTRFNGEWLDGEGEVPLNQAEELYEWDIYDSTWEYVLRTLTSSTNAVVYASADVTADFGSPPSELNIRVYQIGELGRGFTRSHTVQVI